MQADLFFDGWLGGRNGRRMEWKAENPALGALADQVKTAEELNWSVQLQSNKVLNDDEKWWWPETGEMKKESLGDLIGSFLFFFFFFFFMNWKEQR